MTLIDFNLSKFVKFLEEIVPNESFQGHDKLVLFSWKILWFLIHDGQLR